jgi:hypothetical protein
MCSLKRTIHISDHGLLATSPWSRSASIAWKEIRHVDFRTWGQTLRVKDSAGHTIVIPCTLAGTEDLERRMKKEVAIYVCGKAFRKYREYLKGL